MQQRKILPTFRRFLHPPSLRRKKFGDQGYYETHLVAFIDLLGVRDANKSDETIREGLLDLFWSLSSISAPFLITPADEHPTEERYWWGPEISAFSDSVVASYPLAQIRKLGQIHYTAVEENAFSQLQFLIGTLAAACLRLGFLIRGGIAIGDLYHSDGVILGPALEEAYDLERKHAVSPRVLVSQGAASLLKSPYSKQDIIIAEDGLVHFDYFREMIFRSAPIDESDGPVGAYHVNLLAWLEAAVEVIRKNISEQQNDEFRAKWIWFSKQFRSAIDRVSPTWAEFYGMPKFRDQLASIGEEDSPHVRSE